MFAEVLSLEISWQVFKLASLQVKKQERCAAESPHSAVTRIPQLAARIYSNPSLCALSI